MDELPESAKRLLALARTADEPSAAERQRVRRNVAIAIGAGGALTAGSAASRVAASTATAGKAGVISSTGMKLALVCATVATVGAVAWVQRPKPAPVARHAAASGIAPALRGGAVTPHAAVAPRIDAAPAQPAPTPAAQEAAPSVPASEASDSSAAPARARATHPGTRRPAPVERSAPDQSLRAEMALLSEASAALDRGDLAQARAALQAHHERFVGGQLRQERRGLELLTRCIANQPGAQATARTYLRAAPDAVLAARIAGACKLEKTP